MIIARSTIIANNISAIDIHDLKLQDNPVARATPTTVVRPNVLSLFEASRASLSRSAAVQASLFQSRLERSTEEALLWLLEYCQGLCSLMQEQVLLLANTTIHYYIWLLFRTLC